MVKGRRLLHCDALFVHNGTAASLINFAFPECGVCRGRNVITNPIDQVSFAPEQALPGVRGSYSVSLNRSLDAALARELACRSPGVCQPLGYEQGIIFAYRIMHFNCTSHSGTLRPPPL